MQGKTTIRYCIVFAFLLLNSCGPYQKALKSEDIKLKYDLAEAYYDDGEYRRAKGLFEQLKPLYRGKPQSERITYFYANCLLNTRSYITAAYEFESFTKAFPQSDKLEEAYYLIAYSYAEISPIYSLEQKDTEEALNKLQEYINRYPESERLVEVNSTVEKLLRKLERKSFENAKQFYTIRDYKASIKAIDNFIGDYPGTPFREEAMFIQFRAASILAINSVFSKKEERLETAVSYFDDFVRAYPKSQFLDEGYSMMNDIEKEITTFASN
jgi:outer membrane protein assembly factor BamD